MVKMESIPKIAINWKFYIGETYRTLGNITSLYIYCTTSIASISVYIMKKYIEFLWDVASCWKTFGCVLLV